MSLHTRNIAAVRQFALLYLVGLSKNAVFYMVFPRMAILRRNIMDLANHVTSTFHVRKQGWANQMPTRAQGLEVFASL